MDRLVSFQHVGSRDDNQDRSFHRQVDDDTTVTGVFDGHGASEHAADFACRFVSHYLRHNLRKLHGTGKIGPLLKRAFVKCHLQMLLHDDNQAFVTSGTTACVVVARGSRAWVAHVGDARATVMDTSGAVSQVTSDHTLKGYHEKMRIIEAQAWYTLKGYVCGRVNVTRSLGDLWQIGELRHINEDWKALSPRTWAGGSLETLEGVLRERSFAWAISPEPELCEIDLQDVVRMAVSSDGITLDADLGALLATGSPSDIRRGLEAHVAARMDAGARVDNVTVVVLQPRQDQTAQEEGDELAQEDAGQQAQEDAGQQAQDDVLDAADAE